MPLAPYITVDELKAYLDDTVFPADKQLADAITSACDLIEVHVNRDFGPGTRVEYFSGNGSAVHYPRANPIASVTSLLLDDKALEVQVVDGRRGIKRRDGAFFEGEFTLTYVTTAAVPEGVKLATKMTAQAILESPGLDKNLTGTQVAGVVGGGYDQGGPAFIPRGALSHLSSLIRWY